MHILSVWGGLIGMLLKSMGESFLLSKDEPLTPNIDGVMALWIFRRRAQKTKNWRKLDLSILVFIIFRPRPLEESLFKIFYWGVRKQAIIKKNGTKPSTSRSWIKFPPFGTGHFSIQIQFSAHKINLSCRWPNPLGNGPCQPVQTARVDSAERGVVMRVWCWEALRLWKWAEGAWPSNGGRINYSKKQTASAEIARTTQRKCPPQRRIGNTSKGGAFNFGGSAYLPHWVGCRDISHFQRSLSKALQASS